MKTIILFSILLKQIIISMIKRIEILNGLISKEIEKMDLENMRIKELCLKKI